MLPNAMGKVCPYMQVCDVFCYIHETKVIKPFYFDLCGTGSGLEWDLVAGMSGWIQKSRKNSSPKS